MYKVYIAIAFLFSSAAQAEPNSAFTIPEVDPKVNDRVVIYHDPTDADTWYARAEITNVRGMYNRIETEDTTKGSVSIEYITTQPSTVGDIKSADSACVVSLPEGIVAQPLCVDIMEQTIETIYLYEYIGG